MTSLLNIMTIHENLSDLEDAITRIESEVILQKELFLKLNDRMLQLEINNKTGQCVFGGGILY